MVLWPHFSFRSVLAIVSMIVLSQLSVPSLVSAADPPDAPEVQPFQKVALHIEHNVVDADAEVVFVIDAGVGLKAGTEVDKYVLEVEQEDLGIVLKTDVVPISTTFAIPNDWLLPDKEYVFNVAAVSPNGNYTIDEVRFHAAPRSHRWC